MLLHPTFAYSYVTFLMLLCRSVHFSLTMQLFCMTECSACWDAVWVLIPLQYCLHVPPNTDPVMCCKQRRNNGGQGGAIPRRWITMGALNHCGKRQKVPTMSQVLSSTAHLLPKDLRFEHGGTKLASCPRRYLVLLRPWLQVRIFSVLMFF